MPRQALDWGLRYLMCPPTHYRVEYGINPWMTHATPVDMGRATREWHGIVAAIEAAGGTVATVDAHPALPDMVFTANAGIVRADMFIPARMRFPQRQAEPALVATWAEAQGLGVHEIGVGTFEGTGDALPFREVLVAGVGPRSSPDAWPAIADVVGSDILTLSLPDPRFYHVDLVFCPLDSHSALISPLGIAPDALAELCRLVPDPILLTDDESLAFAANAVVVNGTVLSPHLSRRLEDELAARGLAGRQLEVSEFIKAGGAIRCLSLPLDIRSGRSAHRSPEDRTDRTETELRRSA
jgi:N-dimethylarginine dimethylaminohydrolase